MRIWKNLGNNPIPSHLPLSKKRRINKDWTQEIATTSKNEVSQWRLKVSSHLMGEGKDEDENPKIRHAMACRYIKRVQKIVTLHIFKFFCRGLNYPVCKFIRKQLIKINLMRLPRPQKTRSRNDELSWWDPHVVQSPPPKKITSKEGMSNF